MHGFYCRFSAVLALLVGVGSAPWAEARPRAKRKAFKAKRSGVVRIQAPRTLRPKTRVRALERSHRRTVRRGAYVMVNKSRTWKCRRVRDRRTGRTRRVCGRRPAKKKPRGVGFPAMPLYNYHSTEVLRLKLYSNRGYIRPAALRQFTRFMRYSRTGVAVPIHWRVPVVLYDLWLHFGQPQITVVSGYRPKCVCELKTSKHIIGKAVDFKLDGVSNAAVRNYLLKYGFKVGIGYYPNGWHVHVDVRGKKGFWIDYSRRGERAMYALNPYRDLRKGLARRGHRPWRARKKTARVSGRAAKARPAAAKARAVAQEPKRKKKPVLAQTLPLPPPGAPPLTPNPPSPRPGSDPARASPSRATRCASRPSLRLRRVPARNSYALGRVGRSPMARSRYSLPRPQSPTRP